MTIELVVISPGTFKPDALMRLLRESVEETIDASEDAWDDITETWKRQPKFTKEIKETSSQIKGEHSSGNDVVRWLTRGTPKHDIPLSPGATLVFKEGYKSKTQPGVIGSTSGGAFGDLRFAKKVTHPGIKAGNWDKVIAKEQKNEWPFRVRLALDRGARASGHSI